MDTKGGGTRGKIFSFDTAITTRENWRNKDCTETVYKMTQVIDF